MPRRAVLTSARCRTCVAFLWPGYLCFKDIENDSGNLKKWCIYWYVIRGRRYTRQRSGSLIKP